MYLKKNGKEFSLINLLPDKIALDEQEVNFIKELLVDPQTCGPLVISCDSKIANELIDNFSWQKIGYVDCN